MTDPTLAIPTDRATTTVNTPKISVRQSLQASTVDGGLAAVFGNITGGVLLSDFLLELGASSIEIGMAASIPMITNLFQPLGAILCNRSHSRHLYGVWMFLPSRLMWLLLLGEIIWIDRTHSSTSQIVWLTLTLVFISNLLAALGGASWMSWLAALVPARLRGRYFSIRNLVSNLVSMMCLPLASYSISNWGGGDMTGYGVVLGIGIVAGVGSLVCQHLMIDIDPQIESGRATAQHDSVATSLMATLTNPNLVIFLIYYALWGFAMNLSAPFFNLYMLDRLQLDLTSVTTFNSLSSGANMLMLLVWGRLSDRLGNRAILIVAGIASALMPLFWLFTDFAPVRAHLWLWLAAFHLMLGATLSAVDLCNNNLQIEIAPLEHRAMFFAIASAVGGFSGALGTTIGGFLAQADLYVGMFGIFTLSAFLRLFALMPLLFVDEHHQLTEPLAQLALTAVAIGKQEPERRSSDL